jgi:hypothetical protein
MGTSGRAASEAASAHGVSWWLVQKALSAAAATLPDVDALRPRRLDEHRYRSVRFWREDESSPWVRIEPWMTSIVDLDTGPVLGVVDGRDSAGVRDWLFARPLEWRLGSRWSRSTPRRRSARRCACGRRAPPSPSMPSTS